MYSAGFELKFWLRQGELCQSSDPSHLFSLLISTWSLKPHQFLEPHSHHELIQYSNWISSIILFIRSFFWVSPSVFLHLGLNDCTHPIPTEPPYHTDPLTLLVSFVLESIKLVCVSYQTIETQIPYLLYRDLFHFRGSDWWKTIFFFFFLKNAFQVISIWILGS